jgi:hypothetical protein
VTLSRTVIDLMMEAVSTSETSVNIYKTKRQNAPEYIHLHTRCRENLKSHFPNLRLFWLAAISKHKHGGDLSWELY